jgi:EpsI family protein
MLARAVILFVCFVTAAGIVARANESEPVVLRASFDLFPMQIDEWRGIQYPPLDEITLSVLGADDYVNRAYVTPERSGVGLFIGYYQSQRQGDTMHSPLNCLPGAGWEPLSKTTMAIPVASSAGASEAPIVVNRYVIQKGLERQLVLYWYQSHGRVVASEYWGKYYLVRDSIRLHRTDGALVRVIAPINPRAAAGEADAERLAVQFVKSMFPVLGGYLPA